MTRTGRPVLSALAVAGLSLATLTACAETVVEDVSDTGGEPGGSAAPTTTRPISGTTSELLDEMVRELEGLSAQIAADGDDRATLARVEAIWVIARPDVEAEDPEIVPGIDTAVEMAGTAVHRIRPADADKATALLVRLLDR